MKKNIRLTELDLARIVKMVIKENEKSNLIKESIRLITEAPQSMFNINLGNLFLPGKYKINSTNNTTLNNAVQQMRDFSAKNPRTKFVVNIESSESKVTNYDREKFPITGNKAIDFKEEKKLPVGNLSALRAKTIQDYLKANLQLPNATVVVDDKGAQGPEWKPGMDSKDPKFTQHQYVKLTAQAKTDPPLNYRAVTKEMILTGRYFCNGKNSQGTDGAKDTYSLQCANLPKNVNRQYYMSAFETKWKTNEVKDDYVRPLIRWCFYWGPNGKIVQIKKFQGLKDSAYFEQDGVEVSGNDPEMIYFLNINGGDLYGKSVKPHLQQ